MHACLNLSIPVYICSYIYVHDYIDLYVRV